MGGWYVIAPVNKMCVTFGANVPPPPTDIPARFAVAQVGIGRKDDISDTVMYR